MQTWEQFRKDWYHNSDGDETIGEFMYFNGIAQCPNCGKYGDADNEFAHSGLCIDCEEAK